ncbi:MAG: alpha/beta fold hydrolase [Thermoanaerobaculia bacterium]
MRVSLLALFLAACATTGGGLHIEDAGRGGLPVVFVHGNGASSAQWRAQFDHLRTSRRVVIYDLRGMGQSPVSELGDYSLGAMVSDLENVTRRRGLQRVVLVAHSYGGAVAATYAARHPERVAGLVFVDSTGSVNISEENAAKFEAAIRKNKDAVVAQWFAPILKPSSDDVKAAVLESVHKTNTDAFVGALAGLRSFDMRAALDRYPGPKLAIAAADIEGPSSFHVQFLDVPVRKISGAGHWLMLDRPDELNRALDEFLATLR